MIDFAICPFCEGPFHKEICKDTGCNFYITAMGNPAWRLKPIDLENDPSFAAVFMIRLKSMGAFKNFEYQFDVPCHSIDEFVAFCRDEEKIKLLMTFAN